MTHAAMPHAADPVPDSPGRDYLDALQTLQVRHVDAANGYETGIERAEDDFRPILTGLRDWHRRSAEAVARLLVAHGRTPDADGSWFSAVHKAVMTMRSLFDDLDEDIVPALVDGEQTILDQYDAVLARMPGRSADRDLLTGQREQQRKTIDQLRTRA